MFHVSGCEVGDAVVAEGQCEAGVDDFANTGLDDGCPFPQFLQRCGIVVDVAHTGSASECLAVCGRCCGRLGL